MQTHDMIPWPKLWRLTSVRHARERNHRPAPHGYMIDRAENCVKYRHKFFSNREGDSMRRKNKLPSGTYRIRASYYDPDGTRHQKSFSATTKAEAEEMRDTWLKDHAAGTYAGVLTA